MPRLLNPRHEFFCRAYVNSPFAGNLTDAYEAAGYARDRGNAVRLSQRADVAARIRELREADRAVERHSVREALEDEGISRATLVRHYAAMLRANPLDYYTTEADGTVKPHLAQLDRAKGLAVRELVVRPTEGRKASISIKFYDKHKAMDKLNALIEFAQDLPVPAQNFLTDEQQGERLAAAVRDYAERAEEEDVIAIAVKGMAAARSRYPDGNLTTFERIARNARREQKARAAQAAAMEAEAARKAEEQARMAALLPEVTDVEAPAPSTSWPGTRVPPSAGPSTCSSRQSTSSFDDVGTQDVDARHEAGHEVSARNVAPPQNDAPENHDSTCCHSPSHAPSTDHGCQDALQSAIHSPVPPDEIATSPA